MLTPLKPLALVALVLAASTLACSALRAPLTPPEQGGAPWSEHSSPHFRLETDVDPPTARATLVELEQSYAALAFAMQRSPRETEIAIEVVLFARDGDFFEMAGQERTKRAYLANGLEADLELHPVIVLPDSELAEETRRTVQHELAHRFLHERYPSLPTWLDEGLAQYYESTRVASGRITIGAPVKTDFSDLPYFWVSRKGDFEQAQIPVHLAPAVGQLLRAERQDFYTAGGIDKVSNKERERASAFYCAAWRLVHLLMNGTNAGDRARFRSFLADVQRGEHAQVAFQERFGQDLPGLEQRYRAYLQEQRLQLSVIEHPSPPTPRPAERALLAGEVHLLWARLLPWSEAGMARVRVELDAARTASPASPDVHLCLGMFLLNRKDLDGARRELEVALEEAPEDPRYLHGLITWHRSHARASGGTPQAINDAPPAALVERLARMATSASQLNDVAWYYATHKRAEEGLAFSRRSLRENPLSWAAQDTYAVILLETGKLDEALAAIERALALVPEGVSAPSLLQHRQLIEKARARPR